MLLGPDPGLARLEPAMTESKADPGLAVKPFGRRGSHLQSVGFKWRRLHLVTCAPPIY